MNKELIKKAVLLKEQGHDDSTVRLTLGLTAGQLDRALARPLFRAMAAASTNPRFGDIQRVRRVAKCYDEDTIVGQLHKMQKSLATHRASGSPEPLSDFWKLLKNLHKSGMPVANVCQEFDLSVDDLRSHGVI